MARKISILTVICFLFWVADSNAQGTMGSISGTVQDRQGAAVPGATVRAVNDETGIARTVAADSAGRYMVLALGPGNYRASASQQGFQTVARTGIVLTVAREAVVNFELPPGGSSQTVEIPGDAPAVNSANATQAAVMERRSIGELPRGPGNYTGLIFLQPGVIDNGPASGTSFEFSAGQRFSAAGGRGYTNSFLLDGTDINDHANGTPGNASNRNPGIESVREFTVLTETYKAEYGRASGAIVAAVTRSGTNQLHGSAYEFHLNSATSARNFFDYRDGVPPFRANRFGGSLGGPVRKNRTFFFGNYEGWREGFELSTVAVVPDRNAKQGLLTTGFGGQLQQVPIAPGIRPFLSLYPDPNGASLGGGVGLFFNSPTLATNGDYFLLRGDHPLSEKISLFGRYAFDDDSRNLPQPVPVFDDVLSARRQYATLQVNEALRPSLFNSFRFAYNRTGQHFDSVPTIPVPGNLSFVAGQPMGLLRVFGGIADLGSNTNVPRQWVFNLFQWGDDLSYVRGRHALKFGGNFERIQDNAAENTFARGAVSFTTLLALLQDRPDQFLVSPPAYRGFRQSLFAVYGQDDVRLSSRLTLNLGLRWETVTDPTEAHGRISNIISPPLDSVKVQDKFFNVSKKNFEPRAGLAWQPFSGGKTVVRAGAGIYHDQLLPFIYARNSSRMPPFFGTLALSNVPLLSVIPIGPGTQPPGAIFSFTTMGWQSQTPTKYQYNWSIAQQLWRGAVVELAYIGSAARHLWGRSEKNTRIPGFLPDGTKFFPGNAPRRNPSFGSIQLLTTDSNSSYNALQVSVRRTSASGLQFQASYAFSKSLDDNSSIAPGDIASEPVSTLDPDDRRRDRGLSAFHAQHHGVFYASYPFPFRSGNKVLAILIQGWKLNAIGTFTSGRPFTVFTGFSNSQNADPNAPDRPNFAPGRSNHAFIGRPDRWFDPTAFSLPPRGFYGTLGRNTLLGPGFANLDFSVEKAFAVRENLNVRFRAEFYNATNHTNFGLPLANVFMPSGAFSGAAGRILSTVTPSRQIQFGLNILF